MSHEEDLHLPGLQRGKTKNKILKKRKCHPGWELWETHCSPREAGHCQARPGTLAALWPCTQKRKDPSFWQTSHGQEASSLVSEHREGEKAAPQRKAGLRVWIGHWKDLILPRLLLQRVAGTANVPRQVPKLTRMTNSGLHELMKITFISLCHQRPLHSSFRADR